MSSAFNVEEVFEMGLQIEKNGRAFYLAAAEKTSDPDVKNLLTSLAAWELQHVEIFEKLKATIPKDYLAENIYDPDKEAQAYIKASGDSHVFIKNKNIDEIICSCTTHLDFLMLALSFEKDSVVFYASMKESVREDLGKKEIEKLIHEELIHVGRISKQIQIME